MSKRWYFTTIFFGRAELETAIADAEHWIRGAGMDPARFTWECSHGAAGFQLYVSCPA